MTTHHPSATEQPIRVQLLSAEGCHYCRAARALLDRLRCEYPLSVEELDYESAAGQELALRHGALFPPGIFVEGEFVQYGRPSERKVRAWLRQVQAERAMGSRA